MIWAVAAALAGDLDVEVVAVDTTVTRTTTSRLHQTLSGVQDFYAHVLGVSYPDAIQIEVELYEDESTFLGVAKSAGLPSWSRGFFQIRNGQPRAALWTHGNTDRMMEVFLHEGAHYLLGYGGRSPRWLNEGLAQNFEHARLSGNLLTVHPDPNYVRYLELTEAPAVRDIVMNTSRWNDLPGEQVLPLYIHGWALTACLLSTRNGQDTLAAVYKGYRAERSRESGLKAIQDTYRGGLAGLQRDFERFVRSPSRSIPIPKFIERTERSDALWKTCPDGRLISQKLACPP